jgi:hypothetical protein
LVEVSVLGLRSLNVTSQTTNWSYLSLHSNATNTGKLSNDGERNYIVFLSLFIFLLFYLG